MLAITRETKRLIIVAIAALGVLVIGTGLYFVLRPTPTCNDGKRNQDETDIDCGGSCTAVCVEHVLGEALIVREVATVPDSNGFYDVLGQVENPNDDIGASRFTYRFTLFDAKDQSLGTASGTSFILPRETKTLLAFHVGSGAAPSAHVKLALSDVVWERLSDYREPPRITVSDKRFNQIVKGIGFGEALGLVTNDSPFDFRSLVVKVILRDAGGVPLAVNQTEMRTVSSNERRDFRLVWPEFFPGTVAAMDVEVDADVYRSENFLKRYLESGRFQNYETGPRY